MKQAMFKVATAAMANSHSPYSNFPVGAAVLAENGEIYSGCNVENASFPEGWCAETSAIAQMVTDGQTRIRAVLVTAEKKAGVTPCGGCRQRLAEFATPETPVHLCDKSGPVETILLGDLLHKSFDLE